MSYILGISQDATKKSFIFQRYVRKANLMKCKFDFSLSVLISNTTDLNTNLET